METTWLGSWRRTSCCEVASHGFRTKRSCLTNLLEFLDLVSDYVDEGISMDAVYLDFQKVFDNVSHSKLLTKMASLVCILGFRCNVLDVGRYPINQICATLLKKT